MNDNPQTVPVRKLVRVFKVSKYFGVHPKTVESWIEYGMPIIEIGGNRWLEMDKVESWLAEHTTNNT